MTRVHRDSILAAYPDIGDRVELLARDGSDISDPIGAGINAYTHCKQEIERHIRSILDEIPIS